MEVIMILANLVTVAFAAIGISVFLLGILAIGTISQYRRRKLLLEFVSEDWQTLDQIRVNIANAKKRAPESIELEGMLYEFTRDDNTGIIRRRQNPDRGSNGMYSFGKYQYSLTPRGKRMHDRARKPLTRAAHK
jgi:hypothetical protein